MYYLWLIISKHIISRMMRREILEQIFNPTPRWHTLLPFCYSVYRIYLISYPCLDVEPAFVMNFSIFLLHNGHWYTIQSKNRMWKRSNCFLKLSNNKIQPSLINIMFLFELCVVLIPINRTLWETHALAAYGSFVGLFLQIKFITTKLHLLQR